MRIITFHFEGFTMNTHGNKQTKKQFTFTLVAVQIRFGPFHRARDPIEVNDSVEYIFLSVTLNLTFEPTLLLTLC